MTVCTPIISLDLETTGLDPSRHAPWEIAWRTAIHAEHNGQRRLHILDAHEAFLDVDSAACDPIGLDVGGFWRRYPQEQSRPAPKPWWEVQRRLLATLDSAVTVARSMWDSVALDPTPANASERASACRDVHFVGAVPQFDHRMLERWLGWSHRHWHYHLIDVETLVAGKFGIRPPYNTDELTRAALGDWDDSHKHEAAADVRWNLAMYAAAYDLTITQP